MTRGWNSALLIWELCKVTFVYICESLMLLPADTLVPTTLIKATLPLGTDTYVFCFFSLTHVILCILLMEGFFPLLISP